MDTKEFHRNIYVNLENEIVKSGLSKKEIAKKLGTESSNVSYILNKLKNGNTINTKTLVKFSKVLNISMKNFFKQ
ncbi:XRE family transcriptional regulator [Leptotrichia sp. OH3620_COT-345]|uniref:helix-turn-helix domain-containing protein n=1 Tax=Leptotrichia sp. OH3620_COT-345 TaxID=2491048 RepID=UPI000F653B93|nr:helix-turn-helix transcriptional regulator [Leptotrichia sp. OH3620_COT-345]RRD39275.1 XRE family transcriptional regulator [Leptotrichia sp. OH3620_COT-345]